MVVAGWLEVGAPDLPGMSALRTFRLLRPLRTLTAMPGMKVVVKSMIGSLVPLVNVAILALFIFFVFGIIGVQLYNGVMDSKCYIGENNGQTLETYKVTHTNVGMRPALRPTWVADPIEDDDWMGGRSCAMWDTRDWPAYQADSLMIGKLDGRFCHPVDLNGTTVNRYCARVNPGSNLVAKQEFGTGSFDNIGTAMISIFTSITLEGWVDIAYRLFDSFGLPVLTAIYFVMMILLGSMFLLNLALAVIEDEYTAAEEEQAAADEAAAEAAATNEAQRLANRRPSQVEQDEQLVVVKESRGGIPFFRNICDSNLFANLIVVMILANTLTLAMEHAGMSSGFVDFLKACNYVFTIIFVIEMLIKMLGLTVRMYFTDPSNCFDFCLVLMSVVETIMDLAGVKAPGGINALRAFRVLKLAKSWKDLSRLLNTLREAINGVSNASVVLLIIVFIFTLLGMQLFGGRFTDAYDGVAKFEGDDPRHHFDNIFWAFVTVFQVLTGENWNEVLYNGIKGTSWASSVIYFTLLNIVGAYIILNLFMAILLGQFESDDEEEDEEEAAEEGGSSEAALPSPGKLPALAAGGSTVTPTDDGEAAPSVLSAVKVAQPQSKNASTRPNALLDQLAGTKAPPKEKPFVMAGNSLFIFSPTNPIRKQFFALILKPEFDNFILFLIALSSVLLAIDEPYLTFNCAWIGSNFKNTLDTLDTIIVWLFLGECVFKVIALGFCFGKTTYLKNGWNRLDFLLVALSMIMVGSSGVEALKPLRSLRALRALRPLRVISRYPGMKLVVNSVFRALPDIAITTAVCLIFYLIFAIIGVSNWKGALNACNDPSLEGIGCKAGVAIPSDHPGILGCTGTAAVAWATAANLAVANGMVTGCTAASNYPLGTGCSRNSAAPGLHANQCTGTITLNKAAVESADQGPSWCALLKDADDQQACAKYAYCQFDAAKPGGSTSKFCASGKQWVVSRSWAPVGAHFDDVGNALLTVFEVSSGEMWPDIMYTVVDAVNLKEDLPNHKDNNPAVALYFIVVTIMCAFLLLNLFVGVVVDNFDKMKKEGISVITDEQKMWVEAQTMALSCGPRRKVVVPENPLRKKLHHIVESERFELIIMACICINVITMAMRTFNQPVWYNDMLEKFNYAFIVIFAIEMVMKQVGLGFTEYFSRAWCRFDFVLVALSILLMSQLGLVSGGLQQYATLARVLRVARMFRLIQTNKELLNMFKTLMLSLPAIVNVAAVTLLQFFIYACLGMNLFAHIKHQGAIKDHANFDGFWNSMFLLFRMSTGESYNGLMHDAMITGDDCRPKIDNWWDPVGQCTRELPSNCGSPGGAPLFFLSFFIFSSLLLLNLLVAIILDNFGDQQEDDSLESLTEEDTEMFKVAWSEYDHCASGFIEVQDLAKVLGAMNEPLGCAGPRSEDGLRTNLTGAEIAEARASARKRIKTLDVPDRLGKVSFNEVLGALAAQVTPDVEISEELITSDVIRDLYAKKNRIDHIVADELRHVEHKAERGSLFTLEERSAVEAIQARHRGNKQRQRDASGGEAGEVAQVAQPTATI